MAEATKGEVQGRVRGRVKTLCLDMAALEQFERATGQKAFEALETLSGDSAGFQKLAALVRGAMRKYHPDAALGEAQAFIKKHPEKIRELLKSSLPKVESSSAVGDAPGNQSGAKG